MASLRAAALAGLFALTALVVGQTVPQFESETPDPTDNATLITSVGPFVGDHSETWEEFGISSLPSGTVILGGIATITGPKMVTGHPFFMCSVYARPSDGRIFMDQDRPNDLLVISFSQPVNPRLPFWMSLVRTPRRVYRPVPAARFPIANNRQRSPLHLIRPDPG